MSDELIVQRHGHVLEIIFNRPQQRNAMTWTMYQGLVETCDMIDHDPEIRCVIVYGAGEKAFVAGTDISQFPAFKGNPQAGLDYEARIDTVISRLERVTKPVIAAVRGYCVGGGLVIAGACDLRVVASDAQFSVPCIRLGNCLSMANYARLISLVGAARAKEMVYTGRMVPAQEALTLGLVTEVVAPELLLDRARALAQQIAEAAPLTVQVTKAAIGRIQGALQANLHADDLVAACYNSADFQEGVSAFLEKRHPVWQGK